MVSNTAPLSALTRLAWNWHALMGFLVAAMRELRWLEEAGSRRALARAETLEACLHVALFELTEDIARAAPDDPDRLGPEEARAWIYLCLITRLLPGLIMALQYIKQRLRLRCGPRGWQIGTRALAMPRAEHLPAPARNQPP